MPLNFATETEHDAILTSENGKRWLEEMASFPEQVKTSTLPEVAVAVEPSALSPSDIHIGRLVHSIAIPNVAQENQTSTTPGIVDRKLAAETFARESEIQLRSIAMRRYATWKSNEPEERPDEPSLASKTQPYEIVEPPTEVANSSKTKVSTDEHSLDGVVDSILSRTTKGKPTLVLFVGTSDNQHVDSTAANTSELLAKRRCGTVLLVDANGENPVLSQSAGQHGQPGLIDAILGPTDVPSLIKKGSSSGVDFLGYGSRPLTHSKYQQEARSIASEWISNYDYVCISAGASQSVDAQLWSDICDGVYLLVSQKNDHATLARSAVAELRSSGAKLLGCVVTESEG